MSEGKGLAKAPAVDVPPRSREPKSVVWGYLVPTPGVKYYFFVDSETAKNKRARTRKAAGSSETRIATKN